MEMEGKVARARQCSTQRSSISGISISATPMPRHGSNAACHTTWRRQQSTTWAEHWRPELAEHHINVNIINPGWIETEIPKSYYDSAKLAGLAKRIPWKRIGTMTDVGKVITFSCSDDADYITGATIPIDGGWVQPLKDQ